VTKTFDVLGEIEAERERQDKKWGPDRDHSVPEWMLILGEEYGEACQAATDYHFCNEATKPGIKRNELVRLRTELIQTAAVAAAIVQSIDNHIMPGCEAAIETAIKARE
jgi:hypothetical protein